MGTPYWLSKSIKIDSIPSGDDPASKIEHMTGNMISTIFHIINLMN